MEILILNRQKTVFKKLVAIPVFILFVFFSTDAGAQENLKVRIAKIEIDPAQLIEYRLALAEHAKVAVKVEPGVLALNAVYDKDNPTKVTVFEIYASEQAYQAHLTTPHFLKYKNGTSKMVKSLQLVDVQPIALEYKPLPQHHLK